MSGFVNPERDQMLLLPPSIGELIPPEHPVRLFDDIIAQIDPRPFRAGYDNNMGRPAYEPMILLRILLWAYMNGERSSRKIARACHENVVFIYLAGSYRPDFRTLCLFRKGNRDAIKRALKDTIRIATGLDVSGFTQVNVDGTKLRADASKGAQCKLKRLEEESEELAGEILKQAESADRSEDEEHGEGDGSAKLPGTLRGKKERLRRIKEAREKIERAPDAKTANTTDPDSTYMKKVGGPGYNGQAAVDTQSRLITAEDVTGDPSDNAQLIGQVEQHKENTGADSGTVAADAGYCGGKNLRDSRESGYEPYIPQHENLDGKQGKSEDEAHKFTHKDFKYDKESDVYRCPAGNLLKFKQYKVDSKATGDVRIKVYQCRECGGCALRPRCTNAKHGRQLHISEYDEELRAAEARLATPEGKERYARRKSTVETVFGYIKRLLRFRRLSLRGLAGARAEWSLVCLVYNVRRLMSLLCKGVSVAI
jgi:transposase